MPRSYYYLPICILGFIVGACAQDFISVGKAFFLSNLFKVPKEKIMVFAKSFMFSEEDFSPDDISILLYKSDGLFNLYYLDNETISIEPNQDIKIIIHGFQSSGFADWAKNMAMAYHKIGFNNTIAIDWNGIANKSYIVAASSTQVIGDHIGEWLYHKLLQGDPQRLSKVHLVGHSLGAQISGFVGKRISNITNGQHLIQRISALDAAAPLFEYPIKLDSSLRINADDARRVEGYHTNMGFFGFRKEFGHQDFYISAGGPVQPGCNHWLYMIETMICSHSLSHELWTKTIGSLDYIATECSNRFAYITGFCNSNRKFIMGEQNHEMEPHGIFYVSIDANVNPISR